MMDSEKQKRYFRLLMTGLVINAVLMMLIVAGFSRMDKSHARIYRSIDSLKNGKFFLNQLKSKR